MKEKELTKSQKLRLKARESTKKFTRELKKAINTAIMAAFGFLIALVWKDVITSYVESISKVSPVQGQLFTALLVTIICVIGILITARLTKIK
jgi:formate/nitrite transporter FocA (FNT family)